MGRGISAWTESGNVGSKIQFGLTQAKREPYCTFDLYVEDKGDKTTRIVVNVYGGLVSVCRERLHRGVYCIVHGSAVNRGNATELKAKSIAFP